MLPLFFQISENFVCLHNFANAVLAILQLLFVSIPLTCIREEVGLLLPPKISNFKNFRMPAQSQVYCFRYFHNHFSILSPSTCIREDVRHLTTLKMKFVINFVELHNFMSADYSSLFPFRHIDKNKKPIQKFICMSFVRFII